MKNEKIYEETIEILKDNINCILNEKDRSPRWLSIKIEKNDWYITRILDKKKDPSFKMICKIADALGVSVADLFTKREG